nr:lysophospholipid acyltransferase family protein [Candidatus Sigynarchaeota archaeon]
MVESNKPENEKPEEKEKKENPVMKFFSDTILRPMDKVFDGILKAVENAGMTNQIQYPFYLTQDMLWWGITHNLFGFEIYGSENVPPEGKAAVVCANHQSLFDPVIYCVTFAHYSRRRIHVMGKEEMFTVPLIQSYIKWCYAFPVKRGEHDEAAYQKALDFLRQGELVGMYPEGTTNLGEYGFLEPKTGAARMAIDAKVPILPVGITGVERILPRSQNFPNLSEKLTVKIGEPITIHEKFFDKKDIGHDDLKKIMDLVMEKIKGLLLY